MSESDEETVARLKLELHQVLESRAKLVADITAERQLYETQIKRLEIQNKALAERMQPFLKQEEANTAAEQLRVYNRMHARAQQQSQKPPRKVNKKQRQVRVPKAYTSARVALVESAELHLL